MDSYQLLMKALRFTDFKRLPLAHATGLHLMTLERIDNGSHHKASPSTMLRLQNFIDEHEGTVKSFKNNAYHLLAYALKFKRNFSEVSSATGITSGAISVIVNAKGKKKGSPTTIMRLQNFINNEEKKLTKIKAA